MALGQAGLSQTPYQQYRISILSLSKLWNKNLESSFLKVNIYYVCFKITTAIMWLLTKLAYHSSTYTIFIPSLSKMLNLLRLLSDPKLVFVVYCKYVWEACIWMVLTFANMFSSNSWVLNWYYQYYYVVFVVLYNIKGIQNV